MNVGDVVEFRAYVGPTTYIAVMSGSVLSSKQNAQRIWECQAVENNDDLRYFQAEYGGSRTININNAAHDKMIKDYVSIIIAGTGWVDGTQDTSVYIPNTSEFLPSIRIANSYVSSALDKFLKNTCGYDVWYNSANKTVYYGEVRTDRTSVTLTPSYSTRTQSNVQYGITRVIVYGTTNSTYGESIASGATAPYRTMMYRYSDAKDSTECEKIAIQILNDRQYTMDRYESVFPIEALFSNMPYEGDKVHVYSSDVSLDADQGVKDVTFGLVQVTLGLGYPEVTIFDLLGSKLTEIGGSFESGTELTWDGGWQHVDTGTTTGPALWKIEVSDTDLIGDEFSLNLHFHKWVKDLSTLPSLAGMIADGHITGVNANRALAGINAAKALAGVAAVKTETNVSNDVALAGVSVNLMNSPGELIVGTHATTSNIVSIDDQTWHELSTVTLGSMPSDGRNFGMYMLTVIVETASTSYSYWDIKLQDGMGQIFFFYPAIIIPPATNQLTTYHSVSIMFMIPFMLTCTGADMTITAYARKNTAGEPTLSTTRQTHQYFVMGRHIHAITEPNSGTGHDTTVTDPGHDTSITEPNSGTGHDTGLTEPNAGLGHDTNVYDPLHDHELEEPNSGTGHDTNEDDTKTEVDSYPTGVDIYVNDVKINTTPFPGGVDETVEQIIPKSAFVDGENTIKITSTAKGSVYAFGLYTQYGE
jgi:hypothetical protein